MKQNLLISLGKLGCYILLPIALILIPTSWLERGPSLCLIRRVFGVRCPGCGMTRAFSCVAHGKFRQAYQYNKLVVIVFPLLSVTWIRSCFIESVKFVSASRQKV